MFRLGILFLALFVAAGCSDSSGPDTHSVAGDWVGSYSDNAGTYTMHLAITEQGQSLSATGFVTTTITQDTFPMTASGTYIDPDVTLVFGVGAAFHGKHSNGAIAGTLTAGTDAYPLTWHRE